MEERLAALINAVKHATSVLILPHNDPDPDAIAGVVALRLLLRQKTDLPVDVAYQGIVARAENRALLRYLGRPLRHLAGSDLYRVRYTFDRTQAIALVDTQPGAGNNPLPPDYQAAIVVDHHPWREESATALFADVRPEIGAISTMLTGYLQAAGVEPGTQLATALFYGIKTDTMGLARGATQQDIDAYFALQPLIDVGELGNIERAQVPPDYFRQLAAALQAARVYEDVVVCHVGRMNRPDLAAEMADLLLRLEGTQWVVCTGEYEGVLVLAVRTRNRRGGAGVLARELVGPEGSAGGHGMMAGGQVSVEDRDPERLAQEMGRQALERLKGSPDIPGKPLV
jgi:nanoRNase/pAp phosphatase (c-di-AMP/oligoRNAs hydrolase)